jgi:hypothetical protein
MFLLGERQQPAEEQAVPAFWIDPDVEVVLNAHINEQHAAPGELHINGHYPDAAPELMDCYNCDHD